MENVLAVYKRPYNPSHPVVCFDEKSKQLVGEIATAIPASSGEPERHDYEYVRNGTANLFVLVEPLRKRVAFLRTAIGSLQLAGRVQVLEQKVDPAAPSVGEESFDVAFSRATLTPEVWLPTGLALAPRTLVLLAGQPTPAGDGARLDSEVAYTLPFSRHARRIVSYRRG